MNRVVNPHAILAADEQPPIDALLQLREPQMRDADLGPPDGYLLRIYERYRATVAREKQAEDAA